jgi:hypothetical protein
MPFLIESRCECQASLLAELDDHRQVLSASARLRGDREIAPAHSIGADREAFDVAWACAFCGRNTLRSFDAGALRAAPAKGG